jgi:hypothetical protein
MKKLFSWLKLGKKDGDDTPTSSSPDAPKFNFSTSNASPSGNEYTTLFHDWLRSHGEENIVIKGDKVTLGNNPASFSARTYEVEQKPNGCLVEVEFLTTLPDGRVIQDFVTGMGKDIKAAQGDVFVNFVLTTMHILYAAFFNEEDPHVMPRLESIHGKTRKLYVGDMMVRGESPHPNSFAPLREYLVTQIKETLPNDDKVHWFKVMYGQQLGEMKVCEIDLDPDGNPAIRERINDAPWQKSENFYFLKMFILVK